MPTIAHRTRSPSAVRQHLVVTRSAGRLSHAAAFGLVLATFASLACCQRKSRAPSENTAAATVAGSPAPAPLLSSASPAVTLPAGYLEARLYRVVETSQGDVVLLADGSEKRFLPIFVGGTEALSIRLRHDKQRYPRPLTHDLLDSLVDKLGARIVKVQVDDIKNQVFIGRVFVAQGDKTFDVDARPSDAIALATGAGVPILVARSVFDAAAVTASDLGLDKEPDQPHVPSRTKPREPTEL